MLFEGTLSEEMEEAIAQLKPEHRTLVILADVEQMPYGEIAEMLNVPIGTVRSRLHRSHKKLRALLEAKKPERFLSASHTLAPGF
jgi:RNA polymerase sigma-70 factor (ECF subfamily)